MSYPGPGDGSDAGVHGGSELYGAPGSTAESLLSMLPNPAGVGSSGTSYSPSLDLLTQHGLGSGAAGAGYGDASALGSRSDALKASSGEKQLCTFFLRTGTCAYADRCKFRHPLDRLPPTLNSRGYPIRPEDPDCAHYLKKGWCAFGTTCKFNHPELGTSLVAGFPGASGAATFSAPSAATAFPSAALMGGGQQLYSLQPSSVPAAVYYMPAGVNPSSLAGVNMGVGAGGMSFAPATSSALFQQASANGLTGGASSSQIFRQQQLQGAQASMGVYGNMNSNQINQVNQMNQMNMMSQMMMQGTTGGMGLQAGVDGLPANLTKAMQNLRLGNNGPGRR